MILVATNSFRKTLPVTEDKKIFFQSDDMPCENKNDKKQTM